jgi:putative membrane protein
MAMLIAALAAAVHYLALGIGGGSVFMRGRYFRTLRETPSDAQTLKKLFVTDTLWGVAAMLWVATGLWRAFGGLEKGAQYYLHSSMFWVKMGLVATIFLAEIGPMVTLIRWRIAAGKGTLMLSNVPWNGLILINHVELALVIVIPVVASLMARGIGY